jgi:hypothetical protein
MAAIKDWERLAEFVRERRVELGLTQEDVRAAGGPSTATMRLIEGALQRGYQPATLRDLEKVLQWERGSAARILGGGSPAVSADPRPSCDAPPAPVTGGPLLSILGREARSEIQPYFDAIAGAYGRAGAAHPGVEELTGEMIFGATPDAALWDSIAARIQALTGEEPHWTATADSMAATLWKIGRQGASGSAAVLSRPRRPGRGPPRHRHVTISGSHVKGVAEPAARASNARVRR